MKKYIKTAVLIAFVVLSIGTYYVYTALASSENPDLSFETISGEEELFEQLLYWVFTVKNPCILALSLINKGRFMKVI